MGIDSLHPIIEINGQDVLLCAVKHPDRRLMAAPRVTFDREWDVFKITCSECGEHLPAMYEER